MARARALLQALICCADVRPEGGTVVKPRTCAAGVGEVACWKALGFEEEGGCACALCACVSVSVYGLGE